MMGFITLTVFWTQYLDEKGVCVFFVLILKDFDMFLFFLRFPDHQICPGSAPGSEEPPAQGSAKETSHPQVQERYGGKLKHGDYL